MALTNGIDDLLGREEVKRRISDVYGCGMEQVPAYAARYEKTALGFEKEFGADARTLSLFSAAGRTEICGNHTDHQHGHVLAGSVNLDVIAAAARNDDGIIRIKSEGYAIDIVDTRDLSIQKNETNHSVSLVRGVAARFKELGYPVSGFDAYTTSNVLKGSGLSSSAAFEVLVGNIINTFFADGRESPVSIAQIGQYAENVYYGKPCGLMDQMASSVGGIIAIDFENTDKPLITKVNAEFADFGYALVIIDSGADHGDLTDEYAAIPTEMKAAARVFSKNFLREVPEEEFYRNIPGIREAAGDRAVLRGMHFFADDARVLQLVEALDRKNFEEFKRVIIESGRSSCMYLQNVFASSMPQAQAVSIILALCEKHLAGKGAWRVHGGGFAGTVQAFVPLKDTDAFKDEIEKVVGKGMCHVLSIRPVGGTCIWKQ